MIAAEFRRLRKSLQLSTTGLAKAFRLKDGSYLRHIERGAQPVAPWMALLLDIWTQPDLPPRLRPPPTAWHLKQATSRARIARARAEAQKQKSPPA